MNNDLIQNNTLVSNRIQRPTSGEGNMFNALITSQHYQQQEEEKSNHNNNLKTRLKNQRR